MLDDQRLAGLAALAGLTPPNLAIVLAMSKSRVLVGTKKGAFILTSDFKRTTRQGVGITSGPWKRSMSLSTSGSWPPRTSWVPFFRRIK